MWGTLGLVYNPEYVTEEQAAHWDLLLNEDFYKKVTIKDSVRDAFFAAMCIANFDTMRMRLFLSQRTIRNSSPRF
jgi:spermidine/putrescine transport system substrate-binding protein